MQTTTLILLMVLMPFLSIGQSKDQYEHKRYNAQEILTADLISEICTAKNIEFQSLHAVSTRKSANGIEHKKYQQTYKDLNVFGTSYIIHTTNDNVVSSNGYLAANININTTPKISESKANSIAKKAMEGNQYFEDRVEPIELMVIDKAFPEVSGEYSLVYKTEVYSSDPIDKKIFFVDAMSGSILLDLPGLIHESTPATAHTKYHGTQEIITESTPEGDYILQDLTRGDGITTLNYDLTPFRNATTNWDLTNDDQDEVALDAHYATEKFYDMMLQRLGWDGLDGNGLSMNPIVHANGGVNYVNAFWDGSNAWFGNGDCHRGPLTTLEVVGHEFMHGITDYTSDLIYAGESGAINESMSDVFGKAVEYYFAPEEFDWQIGESFILTDGYEPFRYMDDPNRKGMPAFYRGEFWYDDNGVHTNSAIGNLWFHLLVEGRSDVNEAGESYSVNGMGMDKAIEIVWQVQSNYLTPTSTYQDYFESSIDVATSMFGEESPELSDVIEAWKAVGIPTDIEYLHEKDLSIHIGNINRRQCLDNEYIPITINVKNNGSEVHLASDSLYFSILPDYISSSSAITILIEEDILPGNSISFEISDILLIEQIGFTYLDVIFNNYSDENNANNFDVLRIENFDPFYYNLTTSLMNDENSCGSDNQEFNLIIKNYSCEDIPENTKVQYVIKDAIDEQIILRDSITLIEKLESDESVTIPLTLNLESNGLTFYSFTENNSPEQISMDFDIFRSKIEINSEIFNEMIDFDEIEEHFELFNIYNLVDYNNNTYLTKSGSLPTELFLSCPDPIDDFSYSNNYANGYSNISACINLEGIQNPILSFDIVQFRDDSDDLPEFDGLRCRAKVTWGEGANEYIVIEGLEEGIEENITIPLPSEMQGHLSIEFINLTGIWHNDENTNEYLEYDANLIRNVEIKNSTSTVDQILKNEISISPNPGNGTYYIDSPHTIDRIEIRDLNGKSIWSTANEYNTLNIPSLESGYYMLVLQLADGKKVSKPLVNIKE